MEVVMFLLGMSAGAMIVLLVVLINENRSNKK